MACFHRVLAACALAALVATVSAAVSAHRQTPHRLESSLLFGSSLFAADDVWTADISALPMDARTAGAWEA